MPVFVPTADGFKKLTSISGNASASAIYEHLGYHSDQTFSWYDEGTNSDIYTVGFEVFSRNILFASVKEGVEAIHASTLKYFLRKLNDRALYDSNHVENTLSDAVENKSLSSSFLSRVLGMSNIEPDGIFYVDKLAMYLHFKDGYLVDFQPSDGLNTCAKSWKQHSPGVVEAYEAEARKYRGNDPKGVLQEVNVQAESFEEVPKGMRNEHIALHKDRNGLINFRMLLACHYDHPISLKDFLALNQGRYQELPNQGKYRLGRFDYLFSSDGVLIQTVQN